MIPLHSARAVRGWLLLCMACVVTMVFVGGVTRLTESGLSIVEWKLVSGILPPLTQQGWEEEFAAYKTSPEFIKKNYSFGVEEFKRIFWLEYIHRLLGRATGLVFIVPLLFFGLRKALPPRLLRRMLFACVLVAAQGTVGWIMVASGLEHDPRVNPAKLALHLMLALSLFSLLLWTYWQASGRARHDEPRGFGTLLRLSLAMVLLQIVLGALVAGNDAGLTYNTYPLMDGAMVPSGLFTLDPWHKNLIINVVFVQFAHRAVAHLVVVLSLMVFISAWRTKIDYGQTALRFFMIAVIIQFLLGVFTLLHAVPVALGSAHQMGAVVVLAALLNLVYLVKLPPRQS